MSNNQHDLHVDIGCGDRKPAGYVGVDVVAGPGVDIVADLTDRFPFETGSVAHLRAHDVIEHLPDRIRTMNEIWRVCRDGATVDIRVPSTDGRGAFQDPTHVSYWNANSFYYYSGAHPPYLALCRKYGFRGVFRLTGLAQETTPDNVVHVHVTLTALKPAVPALAPAAVAAPPPPFDLHHPPAGASPRLTLAARIVDGHPALDDLFTPEVAGQYVALVDGVTPVTPLTAPEAAFCDWLAAEQDHAAAAVPSRRLAGQLAALLFKPAYRTPADFAVPLVPAVLLEDYLRILCRNPGFFPDNADVSLYVAFQHALLRYLDDGLRAAAAGGVWLAAGTAFMRRAEQGGLLFTTENLRPLARLRGRIIEQTLTGSGLALASAPGPRSAGPIRLGVFIAGFEPAPELFALLPLLQDHHPDFDVTVYLTEPVQGVFERDAVARRARIIDLPAALDDAVALVRAHRLDVAYFASNIALLPNATTLLAAHRLARVQVSSVASVCTSGLDNVDVYLSATDLEIDRFPQQQYSEELVKLPGTAHCFAYGETPMPGNSLTDHPGLAVVPGETVFTAAATMFKLSPDVVDIWLRLLASTNNTRIVLFPFGASWSAKYPKTEFALHLQAKLDQRAIDPRRLRLVDTPGINRIGLRKLMTHFHVCLDTFPFSGSTSLIEPLELGMPVIAMTGPTMRAAMGASLLRELGVGELIAADCDAYLNLAIRLANDPVWRAGLSARIRAAMARPPAFLNPSQHAARLRQIFQMLSVRS